MLVVAVVAEGVDQAQELDLQGDLRGTLTASIVSWEPCPLSATIGSPDEVVKEVAQFGDQLQLSQFLLHLLPVLAHQEEPEDVEHLHPVHQVVDQAGARVCETTTRIRFNDWRSSLRHLITDVIVDESHPVVNFCWCACEPRIIRQPACVLYKPGEKTWHGENKLLVDVPHWDEGHTPLLDVLLIQRRFVFEDVQVTDCDSQKFTEAGQLASLKPL